EAHFRSRGAAPRRPQRRRAGADGGPLAPAGHRDHRGGGALGRGGQRADGRGRPRRAGRRGRRRGRHHHAAHHRLEAPRGAVLQPVAGVRSRPRALQHPAPPPGRAHARHLAHQARGDAARRGAAVRDGAHHGRRRAPPPLARRRPPARLRGRDRGGGAVHPRRGHPQERGPARRGVRPLPAHDVLLRAVRQRPGAHPLRVDRDRQHLGDGHPRGDLVRRDRAGRGARVGQGLHQHDPLLAERHEVRGDEDLPRDDPHAGRAAREVHQAVRPRHPTLRQHDGRARDRARLHRHHLHLRQLDRGAGAAPDGDRHHAARGVRRAAAGLHLHAPHQRVHRPDARGPSL
ncbi:MAG: ATP synthase F0 sector subunit a, partial [uncultured Gemmatimonadaceae bacterium]